MLLFSIFLTHVGCNFDSTRIQGGHDNETGQNSNCNNDRVNG